ncbi:MAG: YgeY family selenium metabolism-linked hydrolase [Candidatus Heimdallarchaeota archaeon]|nr:YgeY family selenium metabolism-linked hydrolase [Candidatus Heimdallarchaeota archaeon]MBY8993907.1 YgeY family selenium metabolism-linked hydrolase [Candidatus Heimdallarchaeota archaeon]
MKEKIRTLVDFHKENIIKLTRTLVATPSETGTEGLIISVLTREMHEMGFDEIIVDEMGNLIGKMGTGPNVLAVDAHVDTVGLGDLSNWGFNPLYGKIEDNKIFGRGSCDQKGGLVTALYAFKLLKELGVPKNLTIYFVASIYEENAEGVNWQFIIKNLGIKPDAVLLTEPSNLGISLGHRGRIDLEVHATGVSSHGSMPDLGVNPIYKLSKIISEIEKLHENLPVDPDFGKGSIAVTAINSQSVSLNAIPEKAIIYLDRRLGLKDSKESVIKEITKLPSVMDASAEVKIHSFKIKTHKGYVQTVIAYYPSWKMNDNHPLVKAAIEAFKSQFDEEPETKLWQFSTNGVATKGLFDIPTIGFGPGDEKYAHTCEEHVPIDHLVKATEFYLNFYFKWAENTKE